MIKFQIFVPSVEENKENKEIEVEIDLDELESIQEIYRSVYFVDVVVCGYQ